MDDGYGSGNLAEVHGLATLGQLAGGVIHDLRNLLSGIQFLIEYVRDTPLPPERQREILDKATGYLAQAESLIGSSMTLLGRRGSPTGGSVSLGAVADDLRELLRYRQPPRVSLHLELPEDTPRVQAEDCLVLALLLNLCLNACDALSENGGEIRLYLEPEAPAGHLRLCVADNGPGMSEDVRERALEPFFSAKPGGTGLGLWMVSQAMQSFGGAVRVHSAPGQGTRVELDFLLGSAAAAAGGGDRAAASLAQPCTVLLVEDHPAIRQGLLQELHRHRCRVVSAANLSEARRQFARGSFDAVVLDRLLPDGRSDALLAEWHGRHPDLPIVAITGDDPAEGIRELLAKGAVAVLRKPFQVAALLAVLEKTLPNRQCSRQGGTAAPEPGPPRAADQAARRIPAQNL